MPKPRESTIVDKIRDAVWSRGFPCRKRHGTVMGVAGDPDIYGSIHGRHFELEVKRPGEEPTKLQYHRLAVWKQEGNAITGWADNVEEALKILGIADLPVVRKKKQ